MKVLTVVGNRPQLIKASALAGPLRSEHDELLVYTGQHYDDSLSSVFFAELDLARPDHELGIGGGTNTSQIARMLAALEPLLAELRPDAALVYGDTNSTLAGALAAAEGGVPVVHVEAGMRSLDRAMPEERNRVLTDHLSGLLLCASELAAENLKGESISGRIEVVGDVMHDACLQLAPAAKARSTALGDFGLQPGGYVLATIHREANVRPERLARILEGLSRLDEPVLLAAHPRTAGVITSRCLAPGHVRISPPLAYLDFSALASQARVIVTDSGGIQKEAYWYGVPCVTARPSTEWKDTVELGANVLVDDDPDLLVDAVENARMPDNRPQLYGDGHASEKVAATLLASLGAA